MGYNPRILDIQNPESHLPSIQQCIADLAQICDEVHVSSRMASEVVKTFHQTKGYKPYTIGQKVWLEGKNIKTTHPTNKLAPKRHRPFTITEVLGMVTFKLQLPHTWKIHPVFHATLLSPFIETPEYGEAYAHPPPELIEDEEEYEVEQILNSQHNRQGKLEYLVKWLGYEESENQWTRPADLGNAQDVITEFHTAYSSAIDKDRPPIKRKS